MKPRCTTVSLALGLTVFATLAAEPERGNMLPGDPDLTEGLPTLRDFEVRRITSADPTGGNKDWRDLAPGQTLVLADIRGPGCIVHFRDNITGREPHHLQRHVLRMFWDGGEPPFRSGNFYYSVAYWYQTEPHALPPPMPGLKERISWSDSAKKDK